METPWKCPCLAASASPWRQPSLFGDDTHHSVVGGLRAWPTDMCSNKDAGKSERKTLRSSIYRWKLKRRHAQDDHIISPRRNS